MMASTRTCVGCRRRGSKDGFVRIVRTPDGEVLRDEAAVISGRGAYVCPDVRCFRRAARRKGLARALRTEIDADTLQRIEATFAERGAE